MTKRKSRTAVKIPDFMPKNAELVACIEVPKSYIDGNDTSGIELFFSYETLFDTVRKELDAGTKKVTISLVLRK